MLKRFRIEVEGADNAAACEEELAKYEHALQITEAQRYGLLYNHEADATDTSKGFRNWGARAEERYFYNGQLGREVTDEVIERVSEGSYRGRRVVQFTRIDSR